MIVIGLSGKAGSGKDTAGNILERKFHSQGLRTTRLSFAGPLKDTCVTLFGWDRARLDSDPYYKEGGLGGWVPKGHPGAKPVYSVSPGAFHGSDPNAEWIELDTDAACEMLGMTRRQIMQKIGTEAIRDNLHQDTWIVAMKLRMIRGDFADYDVGFLTDCRFLNELKFVWEQPNGLLVKLVRFDGDSQLTTQSQHASELEWERWSDWNFTIQNPATLPAMPGQMEQFESNLQPVIDRVFEIKNQNLDPMFKLKSRD